MWMPHVGAPKPRINCVITFLRHFLFLVRVALGARSSCFSNFYKRAGEPFVTATRAIKHVEKGVKDLVAFPILTATNTVQKAGQGKKWPKRARQRLVGPRET